ncbi:bifunctional (p)ppGpp synthetase/guanosine-3',5'-bis(diphosphate) 3'-pyrophosphohydrolase [Mariprofundus erugo]|uniref:Bifunctional (P)ppGpp synthetase/guanosine-3',5'-bis(Diphosphate) 3'-pyrophosphohydrolase n=1 Tax=Mariprofundus erugo TaxID=2528639 RepID=A0A5R9GQV9_9PROT|nr:bifunctional (p)ppGpp synthetase/guanosine-3',5'-bis(diphosphate) 3'-pyrophosphohydrolase [Mariprofundus erugo]TLS67978.1 bifunctional (p)ppGpp synthetase/guanosine-3',5'-bis(diphosphate) 3'-pyrophosphohydrolase [Mariprofundus erugo]TLS74885.1 bifunctional (p)ppGpp synthetase/guanosine-3',5'-bis(diphosphate) 3'-pyrophosphohydrolase [Mariprofundus erugo]
MSRIFEITERVASYAPRANLDLINRAYVFAAHAHAGQVRSSGEPYISHPLAVAGILASLGMDEASVITGLLHDTVEDTSVTLADIEQNFGAGVANLVDGVTKIGQIHFNSSEQKQAENFRKMILATARDLRVLIIKLADRLHNMRTLGFVPVEKRRRIGEETLQIYAPLAHRLGIHWIKQEMEDLVFSHLETEAYHALLDKMQDRLEILNQTRERLEALIQEALQRKGLNARVHGRMKHLYSIYEKMQRKHVNFDEIYDLVAFRVIVDDMSTCYQALGVVHSLYRPVPGRFKDYIALPKPNGYQSLHTAVIGPENFRIEIQIRTDAMHSYAEDGVAAHWAYKEGETAGQESFKWLRQLTELIQETDNPGEFLENVRLDLFVQEVYVFSRDGDIFALPRGARPLDFAYAVHTDVGHHCVGVRINGEVADFSTRLHNGDQIEIMTSPDQSPSRQWLQYVKTPRARQVIRQWFRRQEREASLRMGEKILREAIGKKDVGKAVLEKLACVDQADLKARLGRGEIAIHSLLEAADQDRFMPLKLKGMGRSMMHAADCCHPIPGDPVLGQLVIGEGMVLHHRKCPVLAKDDGRDILEVQWQAQEGELFRTGIEVHSRNMRGMLANVTRNIAEAGSSIEDLRLTQRGGSMTELLFLVEVEDRKHLARVMRAIKSVDGVSIVVRRNQVGLSGKPAGRPFGATLRNLFSRKSSGDEGEVE